MGGSTFVDKDSRGISVLLSMVEIKFFKTSVTNKRYENILYLESYILEKRIAIK
jgi:hypothetical protein